MTTLALATALLITPASFEGQVPGFADYSIELSQSTATLGDVVDVTVHLELFALDAPFSGLSMGAFDVMTNDASLNLVDNSSPGLGLDTPWIAAGSQGALILDDIVGIMAAQFPAVEVGTSLDLYTFQYTVTDDTDRSVVFDLANVQTLVYGSDFFDIHTYLSTASGATLQVTSVPAPGALALLGLAGTGARRRRRG